VDPSDLLTAVDGCGVVTYGLTLERMALAFSRLEAAAVGRRVADAMRGDPGLVGGEVQVDTELMQLGDGWVAKYGAEGLLCGERGGMGVALKVEDGAPRSLRPALSVLLGLLGLEAGGLANSPVVNSRGEVVGELRVTA
jgi:L-asparaginase II